MTNYNIITENSTFNQELLTTPYEPKKLNLPVTNKNIIIKDDQNRKIVLSDTTLSFDVTGDHTVNAHFNLQDVDCFPSTYIGHIFALLINKIDTLEKQVKCNEERRTYIEVYDEIHKYKYLTPYNPKNENLDLYSTNKNQEHEEFDETSREENIQNKKRKLI